MQAPNTRKGLWQRAYKCQSNSGPSCGRIQAAENNGICQNCGEKITHLVVARRNMTWDEKFGWVTANDWEVKDASRN
jgi:hypothetical protein